MLFNEESPAALFLRSVWALGVFRLDWVVDMSGGRATLEAPVDPGVESGVRALPNSLSSSSSWATTTFRPPSRSRSLSISISLSLSLTRALTTRTRQLHTRGRLCHHMRKGLERQPVVER